MKLKKYVKLPQEITYKDDKGKQVTKNIRPSYYFLELDNGQGIVIKPAFKQDYAKLDVLCEKVIFEKKNTPTASSDEDLPY